MPATLEVCGHRVLVKPDPPKERIPVPNDLAKMGFKIEMTKQQEQAEEVGSQTGVVVDIGPTAWHAFDRLSPNWKPWCKVGDRIVFGRYTGKIVEHPGTFERYMLINDEDVNMVVKE